MAGSEAARPLPVLPPLEVSVLAGSPHPEPLPLAVSEALLLYRRAASVDLVQLRLPPLDLVLSVSVLLRRAAWVSELLRHRQVASVVSVVSAALLLDPRLSLDSARSLVSVVLLPDSRLSLDSARRQTSVISEASVDLAGLAMLPRVVPLLLRRLVSQALLPDSRLSQDSALRLASVLPLLAPHLSPDSVRRLVSGLALLRLPLAALVSSADSAGLAGLAALPPLVPLLLRRQALASHRRLVRCLFRRVDLEVSAPVQLLFRRVESA